MQQDDEVYVGHRDLQAQHPEIPWAAIIGMRHKVVHDYMGIDEDVVWRTARDEIRASALFSRALPPTAIVEAQAALASSCP